MVWFCLSSTLDARRWPGQAHSSSLVAVNFRQPSGHDAGGRHFPAWAGQDMCGPALVV
jgi:hypothetical protein